ncbi:MAG: hypothetical protein ACXU9C_01675 [Xanthobacteraceae bacterium]
MKQNITTVYSSVKVVDEKNPHHGEIGSYLGAKDEVAHVVKLDGGVVEFTADQLQVL